MVVNAPSFTGGEPAPGCRALDVVAAELITAVKTISRGRRLPATRRVARGAWAGW